MLQLAIIRYEVGTDRILDIEYKYQDNHTEAEFLRDAAWECEWRENDSDYYYRINLNKIAGNNDKLVASLELRGLNS